MGAELEIFIKLNQHGWGGAVCWAVSFGLWLNTTQLLLETGSLSDATVTNVEKATLAFYNQFVRARIESQRGFVSQTTTVMLTSIQFIASH